MSTTYQATAVKDGSHWWLIEVPELGVWGQAASLAEAKAVAREITALWLDVDPSEIDVAVTAKRSSDSESALATAQDLAVETTS